MAQLCLHREEIQRRRIAVVVISFGTTALVQAWLRETQAPFRLLLDPRRHVYRQYGLERSLIRSFSLKTVWHYLRNWKVVPKWRPGGEDTTQLGGNFVVDSEG